MVFDATTSGANATSLCDVAFADDYWSTRLNGSFWTALGTPQKQQALTQATSFLDNLDFIGVKGNSSQALSWPRFGARTRDGYPIVADAVPTRMKQAVCQLAGELISEDRTGDNGMTNLKELKVGPVNIVFDEQRRTTAISPMVQSLIQSFLRTNFSRVVRV